MVEEQIVELGVDADIADLVTRQHPFAHPLNRVVERGKEAFAVGVHRQPQRLAFQHQAIVADLAHLFGCRHEDETAAFRDDRDKAGELQRVERIADRRPADAEDRGELVFRDILAKDEMPVNNGLTQTLDHDLGQRLRRFDLHPGSCGHLAGLSFWLFSGFRRLSTAAPLFKSADQ